MRRNLAVLAVSTLGLYASGAFASTGTFTGPLTNAFLSVDLNGGPLSGAQTPTNGWNENVSSGAFTADPYGVLWSPWGGNAYSGGDNTQLPSSQSSPNVNASSITKTFTFNGPPLISPYNYGPQNPITPTTVTIGIDTTNNSADYAQVNGTASMNSRNRGSPTGPNGAGDNDMFQDFIFAGTSGSNVQGTNYVQVQFGGLIPDAPYEIALYSYDSSGSHTTNWTATAPTTSGGLDGWWAATPANNNTFTAPSDMQSITWAAGTTPAPAVFNLTANGNGSVTVYGFGGTGSGQNSDSTYLDGFQVALVPEPATLSLLGLGAVGLMARRRAKKV